MAYHPDRLLHAEISAEQHKRELQKFYEVQRAWEALEKTFQSAEIKAA